MDYSENLRYQCAGCGRFEMNGNPIILSESEFYTIPACSACGLLADEASTLRDNELSSMFQKGMNFSDADPAAGSPAKELSSPLGYSSSQHYHHSAHVVTKVSEESSAATTQAQGVSEAHEILTSHNINPAHLLSSQRDLFERAAPDQRERLVQLWSISPPDAKDTEAMNGGRDTSLEKEEELARMRFEHRTVTTGQINPPEPVVQDDIRVREHHLVEPYMMSGYEYLMSRDYLQQQEKAAMPAQENPSKPVEYQQAFDPAFDAREWWQFSVHNQPMELQYGMFDQMSQFLPEPQPTDTATETRKEDEEML